MNRCSVCQMPCPRRYQFGKSTTLSCWMLLMSRCSVINRAVARRTPSLQESGEWDELYLPAGVVSPSEREQIIALLPTWTESLLVIPLRPN